MNILDVVHLSITRGCLAFFEMTVGECLETVVVLRNYFPEIVLCIGKLDGRAGLMIFPRRLENVH